MLPSVAAWVLLWAPWALAASSRAASSLVPALVAPLVMAWLRQVAQRLLAGGAAGAGAAALATVLNMSRCARNSTSFARIAGSRSAAAPLVPTALGVAVAGAGAFATE